MAKTNSIVLPIDVVPNTDPPIFRWRQLVSNWGDGQSEWVEHEGTLPPTCERAVVDLIVIAKRLQEENIRLRGLVEPLQPKTQLTTPPAEQPKQPSRRKG